ncbi:MAG: cytochrome c-type biogenesis protein CcmH [Sulfitobacter sp. SK025]|nr:MAG: cytochrome c-type biogenesis protein CcmH [Sulfitobacter sp. SK025]
MRGLVLALMLLVTPAWAVQPDEILSDPVLEQRARDLSKGLRCLVCRNESIDESNASLARDLRILLRERLVAGDSDTQAVGYIVDRYGEYVLLSPPATGSTWLLWGAGPLMLLLAGGASLLYVRGRAHAKTPDQTPLSAEEQTRLDKILNG